MSVAIPLIFTHRDRKDGIRHFVVDGGLMSIFPSGFSMLKDTPISNLGIKIKDEISNAQKGKIALLAYLKDLFNATYLREETSFLSKEKIVDVITINYDNSIKAMDFGIKKDRLDYLYRCGLNSTNDFLSDFKKLKKA